MKSDLLGIDLQEELAAIRSHKAGRKKLKTKKTETAFQSRCHPAPTRINTGCVCRIARRICANAQELGTRDTGTPRPSPSITQDRGEKPRGVV